MNVQGWKEDCVPAPHLNNKWNTEWGDTKREISYQVFMMACSVSWFIVKATSPELEPIVIFFYIKRQETELIETAW